MNLQQLTLRTQNYISSFQIIPEIKNEEDLAIAINQSSLIKEKIKSIETLRKEFTSDLNSQLKKINNAFKNNSEPLADIERQLKIKIQRYYEEKEKESIAKLQENKNEQAVIESPKTNMRTELGSANIKKVWTFDIINPLEVPFDYLTIDSVKINQAIRNGKREISGLKIYQKNQVSIR